MSKKNKNSDILADMHGKMTKKLDKLGFGFAWDAKKLQHGLFPGGLPPQY